MSFHAEILWSVDPEHEPVAKKPVEEVLDIYIQAFGIDDARRLKALAYQTALESGAGRTFIVRTDSMTEQAQQALLKLLEEPPALVRVVLVLRTGIHLLPTVLSRCLVLPQVTEGSRFNLADFIKLSYAERLAIIEESHNKKRTEWFTALQTGLGSWLAEQCFELDPAVYTQLFTTYQLLGTRGASNKMLAEHIALSLPPKVQ
jgi:DNA polymerase III, delta subunit